MKQEKIPMSQRIGAKIAAAILAFVLFVLTVSSSIAAGVMITENIYILPKEDYLNYALAKQAAEPAGYALVCARADNPKQLQTDLDDCFYLTNVAAVSLQGTDGLKAAWGKPSDRPPYRFYFAYSEDYQTLFHRDHQPLTPAPTEVDGDLATVDVYLNKTMTAKDTFYWTDLAIRTAYALRYWIYVIAIVSFIGFVWCFVFLIRSAGLKKGKDGVQPWLVTKIPGDLWYCAAGWGVLALFALIDANISVLTLVWGVPVLFYLFLFLCMDLSIRCRVGGFWKHTILYRVGRWLLQMVRKVVCFMMNLIRQLPLIWKTLVFYVILSSLNFCLLFFFQSDFLYLFTMWLVETIVLLPLVLASALMMRKLQKAGQALAEGDMSHQIDTSRMILDFKAHGENLNHIGEGMALAVEQRMKSERMKTELITNVSHDIKTPLTSLINYSDLICQEHCDNEKIQQYADVLHRQSERLKRLIEDLVEASKASTGNIEINLAPCDVGVMLTQAVGEYEEKLQQSNLQMMAKKPDGPVKIMADGRRLWRIFDNLMNNICKYAQPGTRVYLTLDEKDGNALISFKNISRAVLDISPDELTERFVRGDSARKSEGNGLGLSIAKSLTELQGGSMELFIDGDLFKAVLSFPINRT